MDTDGRRLKAAAPAGKSLNRGLSAAKADKQDEFYTQYIDIQKNTFRAKTVYCNGDDQTARIGLKGEAEKYPDGDFPQVR